MQVVDNKTNKAAYKAQLPNLWQHYPPGHFAVFAGAALVGAYPSYVGSLRHGYERAGKTGFFVKQITQKEEVQHV